MTAALILTSEQLIDLGKFLDAMTKATLSTGCNATPYDSITVSIGDNHGVRVRWAEADDYGAYVVDDEVGS